MAITFPDNLFIGAGNPIDAKYLSATNTAYTDVSAVCARIPESQRYVGLTVLVSTGGTNVEYWFKNSIYSLIPKISGGTGGGTGTITGGTNGLSVQGKNIALGGTLTGSTVITDARITPIGIVYNNDYSATFVNESLVTKRYVDLSQRISGTTFHIPVYNATNNNIQQSTLIFSGTTLYNPDYLTIKAINGLYLVGSSGTANTVVTIGHPSLNTGFTVSNICVGGLSNNIALNIIAKGTGQMTLVTPTSSVNIGTTGRCGLSFSPVNRTLTLPQSGVVIGYGGDALTPDAPATYIRGGHGYSQVGSAGCGGHLHICGGYAVDSIGGQNCIGGDVIIESGLGTGTGARGNIIVCNLPVKTSELDVLYYNTASGKISYGLASGGTGGGLITGGTNGLSVSGLNVKLGGTLNQCTQIVEGAGNTKGIEYYNDYSAGFTDRSLIDKGYANIMNEKVSKTITLIGHGFIVGNVVGYSGGTYNKPIADGTYNGEILGLVTKVSGNTFEISQAGYINGLSGLTGNVTYFLSDVTAGLLTPIEPIILGHVSKAVLIADTTVSGWMLPYAGYIISTGTTEGGSNTRRITQTSHGFAINDVIGWSGGTYNKAIANGKYNGEVIGIVNKIVSSNIFDLTQAGYVSGLTGLTGLTTNKTYFLSDSIAGKLQTTKPTVLGHVVRSVLATDTPASGWVLPYPGYLLTTGTTSSGTSVGAGLGLTNLSNVFNVNVTNTVAIGTEIPVKIHSTGTNILYIDSHDISGGTTGGGQVYTGQTPSAVNLCGISIGYVLTGKSLTCIIQDMLVPELFQTSVGTPSTSVGLTFSGIYEVGCSVSQTITPSYNAGAITPLYASTSPFTRGGAANNWSYTGPSVVSGFLGCSSCVLSPYVVAAGTQTWSVCTKYNAGSCIKGSKGTVNPSYPTICPLNSCTAAGSNSISGIYPYYYGKLSSGGRPAVTNSLVTGGTKVNNQNVGTCKAVTFGSTGEWTWFAIPQTCNSMSYWCVDAFSRGRVNTAPSDTFPDEFIISISSGQLCWAGINYKVYMSGTVVTIPTVAFSTYLLP